MVGIKRNRHKQPCFHCVFSRIKETEMRKLFLSKCIININTNITIHIVYVVR